MRAVTEKTIEKEAETCRLWLKNKRNERRRLVEFD